MRQRLSGTILTDFRLHLEKARLDSLALFRALDQMDLTPAQISQRLIHQFFELDADCAEALMVLDQPLDTFNVKAIVRDTKATLKNSPELEIISETSFPKRHNEYR